jgi:hypothetical protein
MRPVLVYTRDFCGYCARAKALLTAKGVAFEEINAGADPAKPALAATPFRRSSSATRMSAVATICMPSRPPAGSTGCWPTDSGRTIFGGPDDGVDASCRGAVAVGP